MATSLRLSSEEISLTVFKCSNQTKHENPTFHPSIQIQSFLSAFEIFNSYGNFVDCARVKSTISHEDRKILSAWMWGIPFARSIDLLDALANALKESSIIPEDLVSMLVSFWLNLSSPALLNVIHFHKLLHTLSGFAGLVYLNCIVNSLKSVLKHF